ncbi:MAG: hypothetical protein KDB94_07950, partial [Acidobacteria bacterium]|nr:hypothetical protein [Acidobacteriota bacterium]
SAAKPSWLERVRWRSKRKPITFAAWSLVLGLAVLGALFLVGQVHTEQELAEAAHERIARRDARTAEIDDRLRELGRRQAETKDAAERERLGLLASELEMVRLLQQLDAIHAEREITHLRFLRRDPRLVASIKARAFDSLRSALDLGEIAIAKALADSLLERVGERGSLANTMSAAERERLERLVEEANVAFELEAGQ